MFKNFETHDEEEAKQKIGEWMRENSMPNKIEVLVSDKGFSLSVFNIALEGEPVTKS